MRDYFFRYVDHRIKIPEFRRKHSNHPDLVAHPGFPRIYKEKPFISSISTGQNGRFKNKNRCTFESICHYICLLTWSGENVGFRRPRKAPV
jgi:hypothetical protein